MSARYRYETPGARMSRLFWSFALVVVLIAILDAVAPALAVGAILVVLAALFLRAIVRSTRRAQARAR